ncbi:MAG: tRNA (adenosine(37)-N6)-threonylcarbamoyltransferase complex dimerization subunit type 1 TsaB [Bacteroidota bacterium]
MRLQEGTHTYILAIDTATPVGSVALFDGSRLVGLMETHVDRSHAKLISPMIQSLMDRQGVAAEDLKAVAVAKGPGSYTGLRVGVSTAKGLCLALDIPLLSIGSLDLLAWKVQELAHQFDAWICPMLDARRMEVYCAYFDANIQQVLETRAVVVDEHSFQDILSERQVIFLGNGVRKCAPLIQDHPNSILLLDQLSSASVLGKILFQKYESQDFEDLIRFEPFYLKDFVATKPKNKLQQ